MIAFGGVTIWCCLGATLGHLYTTCASTTFSRSPLMWDAVPCKFFKIPLPVVGRCSLCHTSQPLFWGILEGVRGEGIVSKVGLKVPTFLWNYKITKAQQQYLVKDEAFCRALQILVRFLYAFSCLKTTCLFALPRFHNVCMKKRHLYQHFLGRTCRV